VIDDRFVTQQQISDACNAANAAGITNLQTACMTKGMDILMDDLQAGVYNERFHNMAELCACSLPGPRPGRRPRVINAASAPMD
jgi:hypothetical protein